MVPTVNPTAQEIARRREVMERVLDYTRENRTIKLPEFDPALDRPSDQFALISIGIEPNDFSGTVGRYRYQFEGEEDLLHLIITAENQETVSTEEAHQLTSFILRGVPTALIWLRPGEFSQHFYFGHDELLKHLLLD
jgi:hypothetical protein